LNSKLNYLDKAHRKYKRKYTPTMEDYIEIIYELIENKGYVRPIEISKLLHVKSATVTSMLKKLHDNKLVIYEKYRGAILSKDGKELAELIVTKHKILVEFLELVTTNKLEAHTNAEKIEHYLEYSTVNKISLITKLIKEDKDIYKKFQKIIGR
tara:strand:- start:762 stop:1223 length:462 start_codon:yes stop_codon:yes gene_type:complete